MLAAFHALLQFYTYPKPMYAAGEDDPQMLYVDVLGQLNMIFVAIFTVEFFLKIIAFAPKVSPKFCFLLVRIKSYTVGQ